MTTRSFPLPGRRRMAGAAGLALGASFVAAAWALDRSWFDRHVLPDVFMPRQEQWHIALAARLALVLLGLSLALVVKLRAAGPTPMHVWRSAGLVLVAVVAASGTAELALRMLPWSPFQAWRIHREPRRIADPAIGWTHLRHHFGRDRVGGRWIEYAFDDHGYRVARPGAQTDMAAPSVLFTGESMVLGFGLNWAESIPGQVQWRLGVQSVNLAVTGYSTDQAFMRLRQELPRFARPVAVVTIYMPGLLDRDMNTDRPHLDARLVWHAPLIGSRVAAVLRHGLSVRSEDQIDAGIAQTAAILRATNQLAQSRCARLIVLTPSFRPEDRMAASVRNRVMKAANLKPVLVPLDATWRIPHDMHPNPRAAEAMAIAIAARLRQPEPSPCHA